MTQEQVLRKMIESFVDDPPDTDFQEGFLACAVVVATEIIGIDWNDPLIQKANRIGNPVSATQAAAKARTKLTVVNGGKPQSAPHSEGERAP